MKTGGLFKSSLGRKLIMSLTGLFLVSFLIVHLSGNLLLFAGDGGASFNEYTQFMSTNPLIQFVSKGLYLLILVHVIDGVLLALSNKSARPVDYNKKNSAASFASRQMMLLGSIVLFFLIVHLWNFWYQVKFGDIGTDANGNIDIYPVILEAFSNPVYVGIYLLGLVGLAFHLLHGFQSGFQTLGINHPRYTPIIKWVGVIIAVAIPVGFASMPLLFFVQSLN